MISRILRTVSVVLLLLLLYFTASDRYLPTSQDEILNQAISLEKMKDIYLESKPLALDSSSVTCPEVLNLINAISDIIDERHYVAFPNLPRSDYYTEFDSLMQSSFERQKLLYREELDSNKAQSKRYSNYIWLIAGTLLLFEVIQRFFLKKPHHTEST